MRRTNCRHAAAVLLTWLLNNNSQPAWNRDTDVKTAAGRRPSLYSTFIYAKPGVSFNGMSVRPSKLIGRIYHIITGTPLGIPTRLFAEDVTRTTGIDDTFHRFARYAMRRAHLRARPYRKVIFNCNRCCLLSLRRFPVLSYSKLNGVDWKVSADSYTRKSLLQYRTLLLYNNNDSS